MEEQRGAVVPASQRCTAPADPSMAEITPGCGTCPVTFFAPELLRGAVVQAYVPRWTALFEAAAERALASLLQLQLFGEACVDGIKPSVSDLFLTPGKATGRRGAACLRRSVLLTLHPEKRRDNKKHQALQWDQLCGSDAPPIVGDAALGIGRGWQQSASNLEHARAHSDSLDAAGS